MYTSYKRQRTTMSFQWQGLRISSVKVIFTCIALSSLSTIYFVIIIVHVNVAIVVGRCVTAMGASARFNFFAPCCCEYRDWSHDSKD